MQILRDSPRTDASPAPSAHSLADRMAVTEQDMLANALKANGYKRTATAEALGISRVGLYKKMKKYGLLNLSAKKERQTEKASA